MERTEILSLFKNTPADGTEITVCGWAKNIRDSKNIGFIALSDGGCFKTLQVVLEPVSWQTTMKSSTPVCTAACASRASWCSPRRQSSPLS